MFLRRWIRQRFFWFRLYICIIIVEIELEKAFAKLTFYQVEDFFISVWVLVELRIDDRALGVPRLSRRCRSLLLLVSRLLGMFLSAVFFFEVVFLEIFRSLMRMQFLVVGHLLLAVNLLRVLIVSFLSSTPGLAVVLAEFLLLGLLHQDLNIFHGVVDLHDDPLGQSSNRFSSVSVVCEVVELLQSFHDEEVLVHVLDEASIAILHDVLGQLQRLRYQSLP